MLLWIFFHFKEPFANLDRIVQDCIPATAYNFFISSAAIRIKCWQLVFLQTTNTFRPYVSYVVYWHLYNVCHITFTRATVNPWIFLMGHFPVVFVVVLPLTNQYFCLAQPDQKHRQLSQKKRQVATWRDVKLDPWFAMDALNVTGQTASIFLQYKVKLNFSLSWELIYVIITE